MKAIVATLCLALAPLSLSCSEPRLPPPSADLPRLSSPSDAVPADLDVVLRLDLRAMRRVLGPSVDAALAELAAGRGSELATAYPQADTVWVAFRPGVELQALDSVIVLEGNFKVFDPRDRDGVSKWEAPRQLGGGWRRWDRSSVGQRADWARIYQRLDGMIVALSAAEIDSTERVLERRIDDERVRAPARGALALGVRLGAWVREVGGKRLRWLARAKQAQAYADFVGSEVEAEIDLSFASEDEARRARDAVELLKQYLESTVERPWVSLLRRVAVSAVGTHLVLRYRGALGSAMFQSGRTFSSDAAETTGEQP